MGRAYIAFALANPAVYGLMFRMGAGSLRSPHLKSASTAAWQQLCDSVAAILGQERQGDMIAKASAVWALVHGTATLLLDGRLPAQGADPAAAILSSLPGLLGST